jgi:hypothetical protein
VLWCCLRASRPEELCVPGFGVQDDLWLYLLSLCRQCTCTDLHVLSSVSCLSSCVLHTHLKSGLHGHCSQVVVTTWQGLHGSDCWSCVHLDACFLPSPIFWQCWLRVRSSSDSHVVEHHLQAVAVCKELQWRLCFVARYSAIQHHRLLAYIAQQTFLLLLCACMHACQHMSVDRMAGCLTAR